MPYIPSNPETDRKLRSLLEKFGVSEEDPRKWCKLAYALADKYQLLGEKYKARTWGPGDVYALFDDFYKHRSKYVSDRETFEFLNTIEPWKKRNISSAALQNYFSAFKKDPKNQTLLETAAMNKRRS